MMTTKVNTDYPDTPYQTVKVAQGVSAHAALYFAESDHTHDRTVCGREWRTDLGPVAGELTCRRCAKKLPVIDKENRRDSYFVNRANEELAMGYGSDYETASAWRRAR